MNNISISTQDSIIQSPKYIVDELKTLLHDFYIINKSSNGNIQSKQKEKQKIYNKMLKNIDLITKSYEKIRIQNLKLDLKLLDFQNVLIAQKDIVENLSTKKCTADEEVKDYKKKTQQLQMLVSIQKQDIQMLTTKLSSPQYQSYIEKRSQYHNKKFTLQLQNKDLKQKNLNHQQIIIRLKTITCDQIKKNENLLKQISIKNGQIQSLKIEQQQYRRQMGNRIQNIMEKQQQLSKKVSIYQNNADFYQFDL